MFQMERGKEPQNTFEREPHPDVWDWYCHEGRVFRGGDKYPLHQINSSNYTIRISYVKMNMWDKQLYMWYQCSIS
jgi:hypothetical protein